MYYYLFEPPKEAKEFERSAQVKEYLSQLGIAGEMVSPLPGKSVEDLVNLAIAKRYSTVIAVGSMELANRVARALEPHDAVFGILPMREHPDINNLIGASDWKAAAESLKRRRWQSVRLGLLQNNICFLTPARIRIPGEFSFETKDYRIVGEDSLITIAPGFKTHGDTEIASLEVRFDPLTQSRPQFLGNLLKRKPSHHLETRLHIEEGYLETTVSTVVEVAGIQITTTPVRLRMQDKELKLIVGRTQ